MQFITLKKNQTYLKQNLRTCYMYEKFSCIENWTFLKPYKEAHMKIIKMLI